MADGSTNLRNEDFRKLLAAPRSAAASSKAPEPASAKSDVAFQRKQKVKPEKKKSRSFKSGTKDKLEPDEEEAKLKEILKNYRDRAAERRNKNDDDMDEAAKLLAAYHSVPGDARGARDKANLRKQIIEESKFLGGDLAHTHLVKGLDYSLLNKVRSEMQKSHIERVNDELEDALEQGEEPKVEVKTENKMVQRINLTLFKNDLPEKNPLFAKGRMAYVVSFDDEEGEVPTTLLRSLHDLPRHESNASINANNMLISKLTQVLAYLRADNKKKKRVDVPEEETRQQANSSIFENEEEYVPSKHRDKRDDKDKRTSDRDRDRDAQRKDKERDYFGDKGKREKEDRRDRRDRRSRSRSRSREMDKSRERERDRDHRDRDRDRDRDRERDRDRKKDGDRNKKDDKQRRLQEEQEREKKLEEKLEKKMKATANTGYDECYPGGFAEMGGASDEEEDFSKMDPGNKKGVIKRWDFSTEEEFESYQASREANPRAAYQFGIKAGDGRKTRKNADPNKKLERELNQINKLIEKRKTGGDDGFVFLSKF
ncbi:hypothetical protein WR25_17052 isoform B [Diploscapter pachys]|uniref:RED-like N-terminal domain-containing protein n=1 Tax=Diploscapter pachys TaxID=2018661 RepID=A0A2A2LW27_9BILA|nr:hypothetical protein WR25_17052 isoform B [Diploscapter pachys]